MALKKETGPKTGKLAMILDAGKKILKTDSWRVVLDPNLLTESLPHVPTGSLIIDYLIGGVPNLRGVQPCPGLPRKRITQLWGQEGSGKTTLALTAAAATIRQGGVVVFVDWENAIVPDYAEQLGVPIADESKFMLMQPSTLEEGVKLILLSAIAGADLIIIDSIGAAVPANIANRGVDEAGEQARVGLSAKVWSEFLPDLRGRILKSGSAVLGISQIRSKIGGMGMGPQTEPQGGFGWKFFSDVRLEIRRVQQEKVKITNALQNKVEERVVGSIVKAKVVKCKLSDSQGREENFYIRQGAGIDDVRSAIEIAINYGIIKKSGGWFAYEENKWQGLEQVRKFFKESEEAFAILLRKVTPHLTKKTDEGPESDVDDDPDALTEFMAELTDGI